MKIKEITKVLEEYAPLSIQESYDNAGLLTGNFETEVSGILLTLDTTEEVVEEAIEKGANLIISHHPIIFSGLKRITGANYIERTILKAIKNDIAIYASHTNMDNATNGVNSILCEKLALKNCKPLQPLGGILKKIVTFVPHENAEKLREALFAAGAGNIGNYDKCSYNTSGIGSFRAGENTNAFVGEKNILHFENETKIETIFYSHNKNLIIKALKENHPYEEPAYDIYSLDNFVENMGSGMIGELENEQDETEFLNFVKTTFKAERIKHTKLSGKKIKRVALCGGSGNFLLKTAINQNADIFISADFKYHDFFDADNKIVIADVGHFETEQFTKELFYSIVTKKFNNFACFFSQINTNPIKYL